MSRHYGCIQGASSGNHRLDTRGLLLEVSNALKVPNQISREGGQVGRERNA